MKTIRLEREKKKMWELSTLNNFSFLDFGIDVLKQRVEATTFPWLMSNVIDNETRRPLVRIEKINN
jgi:hypothetical protein